MCFIPLDGDQIAVKLGTKNVLYQKLADLM